MKQKETVTYQHVRISIYCILYFVYAYANVESTHIHAVCRNEQNKPIRQRTTETIGKTTWVIFEFSSEIQSEEIDSTVRKPISWVQCMQE